jgi:hypothetical protein
MYSPLRIHDGFGDAAGTLLIEIPLDTTPHNFAAFDIEKLFQVSERPVFFACVERRRDLIESSCS